ncbi:MAG: ABC transporter permease [Candidatus Omnitrophica bacterium]|nr:ABC transporter permease [Candidatus Omnitrophota bacterium]
MYLSGIGEGMLALLANKFRSSLTMLGVTIGVMAIVAVVSIGDGGKRRVLDEIEKSPSPPCSGSFPTGSMSRRWKRRTRRLSFSNTSNSSTSVK